MPTFASITKKLLGCLKLTYHQEPDFRVIYSKKELTLKNSSQKVYRSYLYGFNSQERDNEVSGEGNSYTAEFWEYSPRLGKRWNIDPVVKHHLSGYSVLSNNPLIMIDPNGDEDNPVFGSDGTYRGDTKEGYTGEVIIYDGDKDFSGMSANDLLYDETFDVSKQRGDAYTYDRGRNELSNGAKSKIWSHIASQLEGQKIYDETFSMSDLTGGKIYFDKKASGSWVSSYFLGKGEGKITGSDKYSYSTTVENIQSSIGVHEYYSHIKKNQGDKYDSHRLAYKNVINFKALWDKTTDDYKGVYMRTLLEYTKSETGRTKVDPIYRNLYNKYKDK